MLQLYLTLNALCALFTVYSLYLLPRSYVPSDLGPHTWRMDDLL